MSDTDPEIKRLQRLILFFGFLLFLGFVILAFWGSYELKEFGRKYELAIAQVEGRIPNVKDGEKGEVGYVGAKGDSGAPGADGIQGPKGDKGDPGNNGSSGESIQGPQGPAGPQGARGETGEQGQPGQDGRTVFTRTNPLTGQGECRYAGDMEWQPESECE